MNDASPRRAHTMAEMGAIQMRAFDPKKMGASIAAWRPRPTDIVITPYGKCGTTWLQQTFHTLRTRGDMDFDDISRVVPWIETAGACGVDVEGPQRAEPRGFKSHMDYGAIPKGAKYVVSLRDPKDALVSMYHFMEGWFFEPGRITLDEFALSRVPMPGAPGTDYWRHLVSWWNERDNPNVLLFSYEHMSAQPEWHVRRLAQFCGIALDDDLLALTLENSSLSFMLKHKDRFDDFMMRQISETQGGLPSGSDSSKVRAGKVGSHKAEMSPALSARWDEIWAELVTPATGHASYAEIEAAIRSRNV